MNNFIKQAKLWSFMLLACFTCSCSKDDPSPDKEEDKGTSVIEKYLFDNPQLVVRPANDVRNYLWPLDGSYDLRTMTHLHNAQGFVFKTSEPVILKSLGVRLAQKGKYKAELYQGDKYGADIAFYKLIAADSITVTDVTKFAFNTQANEVRLDTNQRYILLCWSKNFDSVYQAGIPYETDGRSMPYPITLNEITIEGRFFGTYHIEDNSTRITYSGITMGADDVLIARNVLRGLVDFKYETVH